MSEEEEFEFRARLEAEQAAPASVRDGKQEALRRLGVLGRGVATGAAAVPLAAGDFSHGLSNLARMAVGAQTDKGPAPSQNFHNLLTHAGVGQAESPLEHGVELGAGLFGVGGLAKGLAKLVPKQPASVPARDLMHPINELTHPASVQNSGSGMGDALAQASRSVLQRSRFGHLVGDLETASPWLTGAIGYSLFGPAGVGAAALPAVMRAIRRPTPDAAAMEASRLPVRLANGRFVSAASLARARQLPEAPLSLEQQIGAGMMPPLFSAGEQ